MHSARTIPLALAFAGLSTLSLAGIRPAAAQDLQYTLTNVTFADGATATGSFHFNPSTNTFGPYNIVTTNGLGDSLLGSDYNPANAHGGFPVKALDACLFDTNTASELLLITNTSAVSPGVYPLVIGQIGPGDTLTGSGEIAPSSMFGTGERAISGGSLTAAPVPEASSVVSFGMLLVMGGVGLVWRSKKGPLAPNSGGTGKKPA